MWWILLLQHQKPWSTSQIHGALSLRATTSWYLQIPEDTCSVCWLSCCESVLAFYLVLLGIILPKLRVPLLLTDPYVIPNLYDVWSSTECQWRSSEECLNCFLQRNQRFSSSKKTMTMFQGCMIVPFKLLFTWALSTQIQLFTKPHLFFMRFANFSHI